jgi:hypothetical protein
VFEIRKPGKREGNTVAFFYCFNEEYELTYIFYVQEKCRTEGKKGRLEQEKGARSKKGKADRP